MTEEAKRIFIADDDETVLTSLKKLLEKSGFEIIATSSAKEILDKIKGARPHLILLDLLMPYLGGLEICEMLNNDKETQGIPIIIISSLAGYTDIKKAYQLGVIGYITKPYDFPALLEQIKKALLYKEGKNL